MSKKDIPELTATRVFHAISTEGDQGGVKTSQVLTILMVWISVFLFTGLSLTGAIGAFAGFSLTYALARLLTSWDPQYMQVIKRHLAEASYYPARCSAHVRLPEPRKKTSFYK